MLLLRARDRSARRRRRGAALAMIAALAMACTSTRTDTVSGATTTITEPLADPTAEAAAAKSKALIIAVLAPKGSTAKVADAIATVLGAVIRSPEQVKPATLEGYDLIGFGSGIFDAKHHEALLRLADSLPRTADRKAFIFSTNGMPVAIAGEEMVAENSRISHAELRRRLVLAGYRIVGEFGCAGFNDNSFLKLFGGINKGRPDAKDMERARAFALGLKESVDIQRGNE